MIFKWKLLRKEMIMMTMMVFSYQIIIRIKKVLW